MQRKNTFEDFEVLTGDKPKKTEEVKQSRIRKIDANGMPKEPEKRPVKQMHDEDAGRRYAEHERRIRKKAQIRRQNRHIGGKLLALLELVLSILFAGLLYVLNVLPAKYFAGVIVMLILLFILCMGMQFGRKSHWVGKGISIVLCVALVAGSAFVYKTKYALDSLTNVKAYTTDKIVVAVMKDDPAETIEDLADYTFGIVSGIDRNKIDQAVEEIRDDLGGSVDLEEYVSYTEQVEALYDGEIGAVVYNQTMSELIEGNNPGFLQKVRLIKVYEVKTEVLMEDVPDLPITTEPFIVYLSGMDSFGELEESCRSDVNIIACVNPVTKQVLLVSVPRDAYVPIPGITDGAPDKLTHAGMYGVRYSMDTMEEIFDVSIPYYARINFSALVTIVDALGGIDVVSDVAFTTAVLEYNELEDTWQHYDYVEGLNHMDGNHALAFARERKGLEGGDYTRGKNQQKVIAGLIQKLKSPAILTHYTDLLESVEGKADTNLSADQIASLVKMQLNDGAEWNIISANATGTSSEEYCASYSGAPLSVEILDEDSIESIQVLIDSLMSGEYITNPNGTNLDEAYETESE